MYIIIYSLYFSIYVSSAAAGWPLSELWHKEIASGLGLDSILVGTYCTYIDEVTN